MTPQEALQIVDQAVARALMNRTDTQIASNALAVLQKAIAPPEPIEEPKKVK